MIIGGGWRVLGAACDIGAGWGTCGFHLPLLVCHLCLDHATQVI